MDDGPLFRVRVQAGITLRSYQAEAVDRIGTSGRTLLVVPTGGGKTALSASIIAGHPGRVLFVAHRLELINQTARTLERFGVTDIGVVRADDERTDPNARVQVASIQTLVRRKDLGDFDLVFIDEAHRATADSYQTVFERWPEAQHIGLTATPVRMNGKPLGDVYDRLVVGAEYEKLIADGFIAQPLVYSTPKPPDLSGVRTVAGDYHEGDLAEVMQNLVGNVVDELAAKREGRRGVVFAVRVDHSKALVDRFNGAGLRAAHLDGETPLDERKAILSRLERGDLDAVSNVGILTEGWDMPCVKIASIARPTKSLSLWMQMAGRILRPWNGLQPILLDHGGNVDRHDLPTVDREWSLSEKPSPKQGRTPYRLCKACFAYFPINEKACPHCGWAAPPPEIKAMLEDGRALALAGKKTDRDVYNELVAAARAKGFKPGYAGVQFKERFGKWPPWAWSNETKNEFANDANWQERVNARALQREKWQAIEERKRAKEAIDASTPEEFEEASDAVGEVYEDTFGAWLEEQGIG